MMSKAIMVAAMWGLSMAVFAAPFDGKDNLVCTVQQLYECGSFDGCQPIDALVAAPLRHLDVNFTKRSVQIEDLQVGLSGPIKCTETVEGKLILQGADSGLLDTQDGGGWTLVINQRYGSMILTVAGHDVAFVGMGNCTKAP